MDILLDTCTYIWLRTDPEKLSGKALKLIQNPKNTLFFSAVSLWELSIKIKIGKLHIQGKLEDLTDIEEFSDTLNPLTFSIEDAIQLKKINLHHKDPFDLMLICQAISNNFTILSPDPYIKKYKVNTLW